MGKGVSPTPGIGMVVHWLYHCPEYLKTREIEEKLLNAIVVRPSIECLNTDWGPSMEYADKRKKQLCKVQLYDLLHKISCGESAANQQKDRLPP